MYDQDKLGLCCGSLVQADFKRLAEAAASASFKSVTMWPTLFQDALNTGLSEQDLRSILADNDLHITELDPLCSWLPVAEDSMGLAGPFAAYSEDDFFRIADVLGARTLNVIQSTDDPIAHNEVVDCLAALCERAKSHDLQVTGEFLPWSPIGNLQDTLKLVGDTGQDNCGVNLDTWHHFRSGGTIAELAAVDPTKIKAMQFNDVAESPWGNLIEETSTGRLLPGQGSSHSAEVIKTLWDVGVRVPVSVEVFNADLMSFPADVAAKQLNEAMRKVIAEATS